MQAGLRDLGPHERAERAVHRGEHGVVVLERKADVADRRNRHDRRQAAIEKRQEVDRTRPQLREHRRIAAKNAVGEDPDLHTAVRLVLDLLGSRVHRDRNRVVGLLRARVLQVELRSIGRIPKYPNRGERRRSRRYKDLARSHSWRFSPQGPYPGASPAWPSFARFFWDDRDLNPLREGFRRSGTAADAITTRLSRYLEVAQARRWLPPTATVWQPRADWQPSIYER